MLSREFTIKHNQFRLCVKTCTVFSRCSMLRVLPKDNPRFLVLV